jgi:hypothetical protein
MVLAALIPALGLWAALSGDDQRAGAGSPAGNGGFTGESLSLGDWITRASAIVSGTVDEVGSPTGIPRMGRIGPRSGRQIPIRTT